MDSHPESPLRRALRLTRRLLAQVGNGELAGVVELEAERTRLIRQGLAGELPANPQQRVDILREIQALDEQVAHIGGQSREVLVQQLRQLHQGRKAGKAYQGGSKCCPKSAQ